ncbi:GrpB family protein [Roseateles sp.]|uniref:GrpB family protein n=1 Tax=Roseateles sp. TaxID=1971397 RepID=UPI003BA72C92
MSPSIELVPYCPEWPAQFEAERQVLEAALAPWLVGEIQHIGSTSVIGLLAKPVIDIMAPVSSLQGSEAAIAAAASAGYLHHPYRAEVMHWFCKPSPLVRTHHLHLVPLGSLLWQERLAFRNALRASPVLAEEYAALKRCLAARFPNDREAYTQAKTPFVLRVLSLGESQRKDAS